MTTERESGKGSSKGRVQEGKRDQEDKREDGQAAHFIMDQTYLAVAR